MKAIKIITILIILFVIGAAFADIAFAKGRKGSKSSGSSSSHFDSSSSTISKSVKTISKASNMVIGALPKKKPIYSSAIIGGAYINIDETNPTTYVPNRIISFDLGKTYTIEKIGSDCDYKTDSSGNKLSLSSMCYDNELYASEMGTVIQIANIDIMDPKGDSVDGSVSINITSFTNEELIPNDKDKAIRAAVDAIKTESTKEKDVKEAILPTQQKIKVYKLEIAKSTGSKSVIDIYGYMPDEKTIVTVAATSGKINQLIKSLEIGDMPIATE
jgi:hypothetical protein